VAARSADEAPSFIAKGAPFTLTATALFLTDEELLSLTGYRIARYQVAWLTNRGWKFETNAAGAPRVARAYFERKMVGEASTAEPPLAARHDFGALRRVK
jgi:hypothetical protein